MSLQKKFDAFREEFIASYKNYVYLHDQFDQYRGKEITPEQEDHIRRLIKEIQDAFTLLHSCMSYLITQAPLCISSINDYNKFIDDLKELGAKEVTREEVN